ncbi:winged helix-turn-helix domain-containing protein [Klebsiella sp. R445]
MKKYTIDKEIVFFPDQKTIHSLKNGRSATLHGPSSRCFLFLIENQERVVSTKELIEMGWSGEESAKIVSQATYYQCFVNLRKSLKDIGYGKNLIVTIRQCGMRINASVGIVISDDSQELTLLPQVIAEENIKRPETLDVTTFSPFRGWWIYAFSLCLIIFFIGFFYMSSDTNIMPDDYHTIDGYPECFFFNKENRNNEKATSFMKGKGYACNGSGYYYISYLSAAPRINIFFCPVKYSKECDSITFVGVPE